MASSICTIHRVAVASGIRAMPVVHAHQRKSPGVRGVAKEAIAPPLEILEPPNYKVPAPKPRVGSEGSPSGFFGKE